MSSIDDTDYSKLLNSIKQSNASSILNGAGNRSADVIPGISGDLLQQWAMLGANSNAYKSLLAAEGTGSLKKDAPYRELLSDKLFNDYYDPKTQKYTTAAYSPSEPTLAIDSEKMAGEVLDDMRTLALAAIGNPKSLSHTHYDFFETMRSAIASKFVSSGSSSSSGVDVTTEEATAASLSKNVDYRLLLDDQRFTIAGAKDEKTYSFGVGTSLEDVVSAINADSAETGVKAELAENDDGTYAIKLASVETGKDQIVRVDQTQGDLFAAAGSSVSAKGTDAVTSEAEVVATGDDARAAIAGGLYGGYLYEDVEFTLQGRNGSQTFSFAKGTTAEDMVAAINEASAKTGVTAEALIGADGKAEGIGLLAEKAGTGYYIQVNQTKGSLFAQQGKTASVAGSSVDSSGDGPAIGNIADLGKVSVDGQTYSFADLAPGGKASLSKNPDAALAVITKALEDIYAGRAEIKGFDPSGTYVAGLKVNNAANASTNTASYGDWGSNAISSFLNRYAKQD